MPRPDFLIFELLMYSLLCYVLVDASKKGPSRVIEVVVSFLYGVVLELMTLHQLHAYTYGKFLLMIAGAPLAIGAGWAIIIYASMEFTDTISMKSWGRPFLDGFLALSIDGVMDAVAIRQKFWIWGSHPLDYQWFGVPWANFWAWFIVVSSFSFFIRMFRAREWNSGGWRLFSYAPLSLFLSLCVLAPTNYLQKPVFKNLGWEFQGMAVLLLCGLVVVAASRPRFIKKRTSALVVMIVPLCFHAYFTCTGFIFGYYQQVPVIAITGILTFLVSVGLHTVQRAGFAVHEKV